MNPDDEFDVTVLQSVLNSDKESTEGLVSLVSAAALALRFLCEPETLPVFLAWAEAKHPGLHLTGEEVKIARIELTALNAYLQAIIDAIA